METKHKKFVMFILWIAIFAVAAKMIFAFLSTRTIQPYGLFAISIFIASLLELNTFGKMTFLGSANREKQKDEWEEQIVNASSKISYFALMVIVFVIGMVSELADGESGGFDLPIMLIFCAAIVTLPFVQFLMAKKIKKERRI